MNDQCSAILKHLKGGTITPLEALRLYGCFRLAARIHDLRSKGWFIETDMIAVGDKHVAQYRLIDLNN